MSKTKPEKKPENKTEKNQKEKQEKQEKQEKKSSKKAKILVFVLIAIAVLGGGGFLVKTILGKPQISTEEISVPEDANEFSGLFRKYLAARVAYANLTRYRFRDMSSEEILEELAEIKEGFSGFSTEIGEKYQNSVYKNIAEVVKNDSAVFLKVIRELRAAITGATGEEADKQLAFMKAAEKNGSELRSEIYLARGAYSEETGKIARDGILIFRGDVMVETGGGVMNILVGDFSDHATMTTIQDLSETIKRIDSQDLFGLEENRLIRIGKGLREEIELGKLIEKKVKDEKELETIKISLIGESTWSLAEKKGVSGLVSNEKDIAGVLAETVKAIFKGGFSTKTKQSGETGEK